MERNSAQQSGGGLRPLLDDYGLLRLKLNKGKGKE
jgi:hypothetical protein